MTLSTSVYKSLLPWCPPCVLNRAHQTEAQAASGPGAGQEEGVVTAGLGQRWRPWSWDLRAICCAQHASPSSARRWPSPQRVQHRLSISQPWDLPSFPEPARPAPAFQPLLLLLPSLESSAGAVHRLVPFPPHQTRDLHGQRGDHREVSAASVGWSLARGHFDYVVRVLSGFPAVWFLFSLCN